MMRGMYWKSPPTPMKHQLGTRHRKSIMKHPPLSSRCHITKSPSLPSLSSPLNILPFLSPQNMLPSIHPSSRFCLLNLN